MTLDHPSLPAKRGEQKDGDRWRDRDKGGKREMCGQRDWEGNERLAERDGWRNKKKKECGGQRGEMSFFYKQQKKQDEWAGESSVRSTRQLTHHPIKTTWYLTEIQTLSTKLTGDGQLYITQGIETGLHTYSILMLISIIRMRNKQKWCISCMWENPTFDEMANNAMTDRMLTSRGCTAALQWARDRQVKRQTDRKETDR